jgi:hypothetical protein
MVACTICLPCLRLCHRSALWLGTICLSCLGLCHGSAWWLVNVYNLFNLSLVVSWLGMVACHCEQSILHVLDCFMAPHGGLSLCTICSTCLWSCHGLAWWLVTVNNLFDMSWIVPWLRMVACHNLFVMSWIVHGSAWWLFTVYNLFNMSWVVSWLRMVACHNLFVMSWVVSWLRMVACHCVQSIQHVFGCVMAPHGSLSLCTICSTCLGLCHGSAWWLVTGYNLFNMSLVVSWLRMVACHRIQSI